jgi:hypothetical protein
LLFTKEIVIALNFPENGLIPVRSSVFKLLYMLFLGLPYRLKWGSAEGRRLLLLQVMMDLTIPEA